LGLSVLQTASPALASPLSAAAGGVGLVIQSNALNPVIEVRDRGAGIAAGIIGGLIIGGIIASQHPRYHYEYYPPYPPYPPYPLYRPYPSWNGAVAYCMRRFKSYDPYSMTYLGYDGFRHPCP
jgi:hypothetical protein